MYRERMGIMKDYYLVNDEGVQLSDQENCNLEIFKNPSQQEKQHFIKKYHLPQFVFSFDDIPEITPRIEVLENEYLGEVFIIIISNLKTTTEKLTVEERLESFTFILTKDKLFWFMQEDTSEVDQYIESFSDSTTHSLESIIAKTGLLTYKSFASELDKQNKKINELHRSAPSSTSNKILIKVADTERDMVMLQHAIENQVIAFEKLFANEGFITNLNNDLLVYDIKWYNRQVKQLVEVYRDLLDATNSLFTDIMSNNLNQLMKFLSTVSIILAASTFVASLWGMNTGGLPFQEHEYGTLFMLFFSVFTGFIMYLFLKNKDFFK